RRRARRLPLPAQPGTPTPPTQKRPRRRAGAAAQPRPHRGPVLLPVPRPAHRRPHRTRSPRRYGPCGVGHHRALPRAPRLQGTLHRPDPGDLHPPAPPRPPPRGQPREDLRARTHRPTTAGTQPPRPTPPRLHATGVIDEITRPRSAERQFYAFSGFGFWLLQGQWD